jgi:H+/Cl- antiporter ClcA
MLNNINNMRESIGKKVDFDYKNYLSQIVFLGLFFGVIVCLIKNYGNDSLFNDEYTREVFKEEAFKAITGILGFIYAMFSILFSVTADYRKFIINYNISLLKYLFFFIVFLIGIIVLFNKLEFNILDTTYCILNLLKNSCTLFLFISILFKIKAKSVKL